jgi:O-antigen/teichoic acid export membrane protein
MSFLRYFLYNLLGNVLPMFAALVAMPVIAHHAGVDRLGALGIVWSLVGYFGLLDFGLSRVVTRRIALAVEKSRIDAELGDLRGFLCWWAVPGLIAITFLLIGSKFAFARYFPQGSMGQELARGWIWIALCVPVSLATNWLRGVLEGLQHFAHVNLLRTIFGTWNYAAPALAALINPTLEATIMAIAVGRALALLAHVGICYRVMPGIVTGHAPRHWPIARLFLQEGGWISVSNLVGPLMVYFDRFVLAAVLPARAVAWYVTSQEMMLRTLVIPGALAGALFPKFSGTAASDAESGMIDMYERSVRVISAMMLPLCALAAVLAYDAIKIWLGESFASNSYRVIEIIAIGIFVNSIAYMPFAWLQGVGLSHIVARIHLIELPAYAFALYFLVKSFGIDGAAWAWTIRGSADCLLLSAVAHRRSGRTSISIAVFGALFVMLAGLISGPEQGWQWRVMTTVVVSTLSLFIALYGLLNREDRKNIFNRKWNQVFRR